MQIAIAVPEVISSKATEDQCNHGGKHMPKVIYNTMKLSIYHLLFHGRKALIIGAGAVGTYFMEFLAKMGLSPDALDFDSFTLENAAKHSCLIRSPEDAGRNKAECSSERVQPLLNEGCTSNGIDSDLRNLGPEAFADYDIVFSAVDNRAAEVLLNELIRQLPEDRRPIIIKAGTHGEMAQSVILDNKEFCLRCLIDEGWMKNATIRTSCTGPQYMEEDGVKETVRTTNRASAMAAYLGSEQYRGHVLGVENVMNRRLTYTAYPHLELSTSHPMRKHNCPGCAIHPPANIEWLHGCMINNTLQEILDQITQKLNTTEFEVSIHRLHYNEITYARFIVSDVCHSCGKPIKVMRHEGRVFLNGLLCEECSSSGKHAYQSDDFFSNDIIRVFTVNTDEEIRKMTMYELGYPLGAHIEVIQRNGAFDFLDDGIRKTVFALDGDSQMMHNIKKL